METQYHRIIDLGYADLAIGLGLILVVSGLSRWEQLKLEGELIVGAGRTLLQLLAVGYILKYVFAFNEWYLTMLAILIMVVVASRTVTGRQRKRTKGLTYLVGFAMTTGSGISVFIATQVLLQIKPWYEPHYLIPIAGMVIGNSMNGATLAVERIDSEIEARRMEIEAYLALGATAKQAASSCIRSAMRAAMIPTINSMMVVGIVSLPGMMTGQILSGISPLIAVKYQIIIMYMIAFSVAASSFILAKLRFRRYFTTDHQLREEAF
ncbi:MAG TPA: iron export ABC transporter permease subunit FetB [Thermodesulfobacteriota bacterium]|jgi:putative ABC transport system permease protein|nr:iron export ABC transporter permease subunit FetB [Thermodesulfobacteriota bacterium]